MWIINILETGGVKFQARLLDWWWGYQGIIIYRVVPDTDLAGYADTDLAGYPAYNIAYNIYNFLYTATGYPVSSGQPDIRPDTGYQKGG